MSGNYEERWRRGKIVKRWKHKKKEFLGERGVQEEEEERIEYEVLEIRDKKKQEEERGREIDEARYNKWYRRVRGEGIPDYLKKGWAEKGREG